MIGTYLGFARHLADILGALAPFFVYAIVALAVAWFLDRPKERSMTFPTAGSQVYYNDAGEPLGWDNPGPEDPPGDDDENDYFDDEPYDDEDEDDEDDN